MCKTESLGCTVEVDTHCKELHFNLKKGIKISIHETRTKTLNNFFSDRVKQREKIKTWGKILLKETNIF